MKKNLLPCLLAGLFSVGVSVHAAELPRWKQADYVTAIQAARAGQPGGALLLLEQERQKGALPTPLLDDYLTLLCWDGRSVEALSLWKAQPDPGLTPPTLGLLARKARDQHDYALAQQLYRTVLNSHPTSDASAGLAMTQADAGQLPQALATLAAAGKPATRADELELARARSYVLVQGGDLTAGLSDIQAAMQRFPGDRELARTYVTLLLKLGAPGEAHRFIRQSGGVDRTLDVQTELDQAAVTSRWGVTQESLETGAQRYQLTDLALQQNQIVSEQLRPDEQRFRDGALNDRLIMLQQRDRSAEVIRAYEQHQPFTPATYTQAAVADAYLAQKKPQQAVPLYRAAIAAAPNADEVIDWRIALIFALLESGQSDQARQEMAALKRAVPRTRYDAPSRQTRYNGDYQKVMLTDAMLQAYLDNTREAWKKLDALLAESPFNTELRNNRGSLALMRGWPRQAAGIFARVKVDEPQAYEASSGLASAAMDTYEFDQARQQLDYLNGVRPGWRTLTTLQDRWYWETRPELVVEVGKDLSGARGAGEQNAWDSQSRLYSSPYGHWRVFAQHNLATAHYSDEGKARYEAGGLGAQYRDSNGVGEFGLLAALDGSRRGGGFAGYTWTPDDHWSLGLRHEENSSDVPLKGRLDDLHGRRSSLALGYRVSDYRSFNLDAAVSSLSDGNLRKTLGTGWTERWYSGPVYKLDTTLALAASHNDEMPDARYFNPKSDVEVGLTTVHDWKLWGYYDDTLHQRLGLTVGQYAQQGYASGLVWSYFVEQEWQWSHRGSVRYGFSRTRHPYDGAADFGNRAYITLDWRF